MLLEDVFIFSLLGGAAGGSASWFLMAYNKFENIPTLEEVEEAKKSIRKRFLIVRTVFGAYSAFIFSLYLMDDCINGGISISKLTFYSAMIGFNAAFLPAVSNGIVKLIVKTTSK